MTSAVGSRPSLWRKLVILYWDLRIPNSLFGLPMTYVGMVLASRGAPAVSDAVWITLAFFGARTFGHAMNQLADKDLDAQHPNKRDRALPSGQITVREMLATLALMATLFFFAAYQLNLLAYLLAPAAIAYMVFYAYTKRFTWTTSLVMGGTTSMSIAGGWIGVTGTFTWEVVYLFAASYFWVSGFDIMYHTRDYEFGVQHRLHSMVSKLGIRNALWTCRIAYAVSAVLFLGLAPLFDLSVVFYPFWLAAVGTLVAQHWIFDPHDFSKAWRVFFHYNAAFSVFILLGVAIGQLV